MGGLKSAHPLMFWRDSPNLSHDMAGNLSAASCCIRLIGIDMHCESIFLRHTNNGIAEHKFSSCRLFYLHIYDLSVLHSECRSI